jgi:lincosamide nucleotidyltransferase B/F
MPVQEAMIARLRDLCLQDERVVAALLYGSFTRGEGDAFSDIEAALFFVDDALRTLDQQAWVQQIAPVALYFDDDFGHHTAIFTNLIRGEFHFEPASAMATVASWQGNAWFPNLDAAVLVDRTGKRAPHLQALTGPPPNRDTPACVQRLFANFINAVLLGTNVLTRGEVARALEVLAQVHRNLLWMARLLEHATEHWPTPARAAEQDLSAAACARYVACTAPAQQDALWMAYRASWIWGREMMQALARRHNLSVHGALLAQMDRRLLEQQHGGHGQR